ncbi:MAG TPA: response regulator [Anaerolineae bacterium]|nr:response regulator [Anaerolineae bacterium]HID85636.1 response regulator [Anaerolineales bacterium]HIQ09615.1 response regulator [Anaerolineaceae bacterium]
MPGIEGYDVLFYLRRDPRLKVVPVIVVTSEAQQEAHQRARQTSALTVIVKPPTLEQIEEALRRAGIL